MEAHKNNIKQFLTATDRCFMIPVYQRNYDWNEENCSQLWRDIWVLTQTVDKTHFIGTICSKAQNGYEKTIIDGQQRITTITLLVKAMHDSIDNKEFKEDLNKNYLRNTGYGVTADHFVKLHLNKRDDIIFNKLLKFSTIATDESFTTEEIDSRIYQNYMYFCDRVKDLTEIQVAGVKMALDRLVFVDLDIETEDPQEIFESLNSTGLDLTKVDLIRNYLLMSLDREAQEHLYEDYWFAIEENVRPKNMVNFFTDYLIFFNKSDSVVVNNRRGHINENNLYIAFRKHYESCADDNPGRKSAEITELILKDMHRCSILYKDLVFADNLDMNNLDEMARTIYSIVNINQGIGARAVLMHINELYKSQIITYNQAMEMFKACLSLVFRSRVVGNVGLSGQFAGNVLNQLSKDQTGNHVDALWRALRNGKGRYKFPADTDFFNSLVTRNLYSVLHGDGTKYLLYTLEQNSACSKGLPRYDVQSITIDHIMPQKLSSEWTEYLGEDIVLYDDHLDKLGNLALTNYNSEMQNKPFDEKKGWYRDSSFSHTRELMGYESWSMEKIRSRGRDLARECVAIWTYPAKYQTMTIEDFDNDNRKRKSPFSFSMIQLKKGDVIEYINDPSKLATVYDDHRVEYAGNVYSLSALAAYLDGKDTSYGYVGPDYFIYEGRTLNELREEHEANIYIKES